MRNFAHLNPVGILLISLEEQNMKRYRYLFLIVFLFHLGLCPARGQAVSTQTTVGRSQIEVRPLVLTDAEKKWLQEHPVLRVGLDPYWAPIEWRDSNGQYQGLSVEYLHRVEAMLGVQMEIVQTDGWNHLMTMAQERNLDMFSCVKETEKRKKFLAFTAPYLNFSSVIFTTAKTPFVQSLEELNGKKVAVVDQYLDQEYLSVNYPKIQLIAVKNTEEGIEKLRRDQACAFVGNLLTTTRYLSQTGHADIRVAGKANYETALSMAVRSDWPELVPILEKALNAIPSAEKEEVLKRWTSVEYVSRGWEATFLKWALGALALGFVFIVQLRVLVARRTAALSKEVERRKLSEEALCLSEEKFSKAFHVSPAIVTLSSEDGVYLDVNATFEQKTGYSRDEAIGRHHLQLGLWQYQKEYERFKEKLVSQGYLHSEECHFYSKNGEKMAGLLSVECIEIGGRRCSLSVVIDITDRQRLEAQLLQSQKMESVGRLAGGVAHDFNNILSIILGQSDLMLDELPPDSPLREDMMEILTAAERAKALTSQLLAFSRKQVLKVTSFNLDHAVQNMLKMVQRLLGEDIRLSLDFNPGNHWVSGDFMQIEQVILNLCVNARDAMPHGGELMIETGERVLQESDMQAYPDLTPGMYVTLNVRDNGMGMTEEVRQRIFDPFFTTKGKGQGTGLGLAMVYGIVKQHSGCISVASEPEQGSTFKILLPQILETASLEESANKKTSIQRGNGESVLVVEDDAAVRKLACHILNHLGYNALDAANLMECQKIIQEAAPLDLLLTDVIMPDKNGLQIQALVKEAYPEIKTVFMSGYTEDVVEYHGVVANRVHFISKPFNEESLSIKLREALGCKVTA